MRTINKALFLDLDGTLIVTKSGKTFAKDKDDWQFNKNILAQVEKYVEKNFYIMIVSNQGGIETGAVKLNDFRQKLRKITNDLIVQLGLPLSRVGSRFTVTNNQEDYFRKPNPGMAYDLALSYILDLSESLMVGDASGKSRKITDVFRIGAFDSEWLLEDNTPVVVKPGQRIMTHGGNMGTLVQQDFSDSDMQFAKKAGIPYIDIEDFLNTK